MIHTSCNENTDPRQRKLLLRYTFVVSIVALLWSASPISAQKFNIPISNRLSLGGSMGISTGNTSYDINVAPVLTYHITSWLAAGVAPSYQYRDFKGSSQEVHIIAGRLFLQAYPIQQISLHMEYEYSYYHYNQGLPSRSMHNLLLGGGFRQKITQKTYATASILWYLLPNEYTPVNNPVYRAGVDYLF